MIVPDLNLLIYAVHRESPMHKRASRWLQQLLSGDEPVGLPWTVILGFLRITTNPRVFGEALPIEHATSIVDGWIERRIVQTAAPGESQWRILQALLDETGAAANRTSDAHLAALCIERGAELHSADADFGRFNGLRWKNPLSVH